MSTGGPGRPSGTQNKPGHAAGGSRPGAGRKPSTGHQFTSGSSLPRGTIPGEFYFTTCHLLDILNIFVLLGLFVSGSGSGDQQNLAPMFRACCDLFLSD